MGGVRILLVDDDVRVRKATARFLTAVGYEVRAFAKPAEAAEALATEPHAFGAAILDVDLDGEDGVALFHTLRVIAPELCVVFATGSDASAVRASACAPVVRKPWNPDELLALLPPP
jgi:two-component system phosphate regulon response regulator OmpR